MADSIRFPVRARWPSSGGPTSASPRWSTASSARRSRSCPTSLRPRASASSAWRGVPGRRDRARRHARHPSPRLPHERGDGARRDRRALDRGPGPLVVDAAEKSGQGRRLHPRDCSRGPASPAILALNKIDLVAKETPAADDRGLLRAPRFRARSSPSRRRRATGSSASAGLLAANLPEGEPAYPEDFLTSTPETEWIAEVIREKLLERTREELPVRLAPSSSSP